MKSDIGWFEEMIIRNIGGEISRADKLRIKTSIREAINNGMRSGQYSNEDSACVDLSGTVKTIVKNLGYEIDTSRDDYAVNNLADNERIEGRYKSAGLIKQTLLSKRFGRHTERDGD
ncbi:MAG: hypothetical protein NTV24_02420 [Candidatus Woesebacteria bacterium]|nr:hypothetical protein [Candidatus Woesebacteria bacterium]